MCSSTFGPAFSTTIERAPSSERIKRDSSTHLASTVGTGGGPAFVRVSNRNASLLPSTSAHTM